MAEHSVVFSYDRFKRRLVVRLRRERKPSRYAIVTLRKHPTVRWGVETSTEPEAKVWLKRSVSYNEMSQAPGPVAMVGETPVWHVIRAMREWSKKDPEGGQEADVERAAHDLGLSRDAAWAACQYYYDHPVEIRSRFPEGY